MDKCQCHSHGFCEFFQQEMTYDPPNWQWCQNASPQDRAKYKEQVDKKHKRREYQGLTGSYITLSTLVETCRSKVIPKLHQMGISGIAGVPRSGCLVASVCATNSSSLLCMRLSSSIILFPFLPIILISIFPYYIIIFFTKLHLIKIR